jgi:hypothetical protein
MRRDRSTATIAAIMLAGTAIAFQTPVAAQNAGTAAGASPAAARSWTPPRTPDGQPDLQGVWDYRTATPLERPRELGSREFLTDEEIAAFEKRAAEREDGRPPDDARSDPSVHPVWWLDYGKRTVGTRRSSLIVEPSDGRIPPLTAQAQKRAADRRQERAGRGPADGPEDRSLWERCITRGLPEGMLPAGYNNNVQFVQTPGYVVIFTEMIHDARIVPLDGRPHLPRRLGSWLGDSRGRWDGDTLVVETTNFSGRANFRGSSEHLKLTERFTRVSDRTIEYRFTVEDPTTWAAPWSVTFPLSKSDGPMYEYACHEGNYGLRHILVNARALDQPSTGGDQAGQSR